MSNRQQQAERFKKLRSADDRPNVWDHGSVGPWSQRRETLADGSGKAVVRVGDGELQ